MLKRWLAGLGLALFITASGQAGYLTAKAWLAQELIAKSWHSARSGNGAPPPWPWADTHPVAKLKAPRLAVERYVLAGASGRNLAFGPTLTHASAPFGTLGNSVVSGHRDTHFLFLRELLPGDKVIVETLAGNIDYRVTGSTVVDGEKTRIQVHANGDNLILVTCYPFTGLRSNAKQRYLVFATRHGAESSDPDHADQITITI